VLFPDEVSLFSLTYAEEQYNDLTGIYGTKVNLFDTFFEEQIVITPYTKAT